MKKIHKYSYYLFLGLISISLITCKKKDDATPGNVVKGSISLEVHAVHHSWDVSGIMIYLERNATEFPGKDSSIYDFSMQADGYGKATFENLYPGNYYVYASGYDAAVNDHVFGYYPIVLDLNHTVNNLATLTLYVSE